MLGYEILNDDVRLRIVDEIEDIRQSIERILTTRKGEWFLNTDFGLSFDNFYVKNPDLELIKLDIIEALSQEERIDEIGDIEIEFLRQERKAKIKFDVTVENETIQGEVTF